MIRKLTTPLLLPLCLTVISLTYYEIIFDLKRNPDKGILQRYNELNLYVSNVSDKTVQKQENKSLELIRNGIFWSDYAESLMPKGKPFPFKAD